MFWKATRSEILLEAAPDVLPVTDQNRMGVVVTLQMLGHDRGDVNVSSPRVGDFLLGHGGA